MSQASQGLDEADREPEITWVGEQRLMHGYCGRATSRPMPRPDGQGVRPVAVVRTRPRQGKVVRIGPPRAAVVSPVG